MSLPAEVEPLPLAELMSALMPAVLAQGGDLFAVKDAAGRYVHASEAFARWLQREPAAVLGQTDADLFGAEAASAFRTAEQRALAQAEPVLSEHRFDLAGARQDFSVLRLAGEGRRWLAAVWRDQAAGHRREAQLRQAVEQIEQQQRAIEQLRRESSGQSLRDPVSGLYTRAHFEDQLRREVDLSTREHREFAIVFIDLDPLPEKARALGAAAEVRIHETMGRLLRGGTRVMDASCRYDEHRFAVLLSGVGLATAHSRMDGLRRQAATQIVVVDGQDLNFTVSMGVASFPHTAQSQDELVAACIAALTEANRRGGNHVTLAAIRFEGA